MSEGEINTEKIHNFFNNFLNQVKYEGIFGIANFSSVFNNLIFEQQNKLKQLLQNQFIKYLVTGSIISLGIFYCSETIDFINVEKNGKTDKDLWNRYGDDYLHLNELLKTISQKIAEKYNGLAIPPTTETPSQEVKNVKDYFPKTISHRVVAEYAGIGWRGINELLVTEEHGPAVRLASVLINIPLIQGKKMESKCGNCSACLDVCPILKNKTNLEDYRELCRKYMLSLGLKHDVCGKCIKACIKNSNFKDQFKKN